MNNQKGYVSVTHLQDLLDSIVAQADTLDEAQRSPEGDDFNDLYHLAVAKLSGLISNAGVSLPEAPAGLDVNTDSQESIAPQTPLTYQVGKVLMAIILRIRLADARALVTAFERCWQEQANGNAGSQARVSNDFEKLTQEIAGRMVPSDRQYVETLLTSSPHKISA